MLSSEFRLQYESFPIHRKQVIILACAPAQDIARPKEATSTSGPHNLYSMFLHNLRANPVTSVLLIEASFAPLATVDLTEEPANPVAAICHPQREEFRLK